MIGEEIDADAKVTGSRISSLQSGMTGKYPVILSNIISSSVELHAKTGGIVPEVASREQMRFIVPVVSEALLSAANLSSQPEVHPGVEMTKGKEWIPDQVGDGNYFRSIKLLDDITHVAVTAGPGLIGSLLVGFNAAKTLAYARDLPIIPINHIEGHLYSAFSRVISKSEFSSDPSTSLGMTEGLSISNPPAQAEHLRAGQVPNPKSQVLSPMFPVLALTVSGGHTMLVLMKDHGKYEILGATIDDAVGEAYDKVSRLLGLGYPGGPAVSELANQFRNGISNFKFLISKQIPIHNSQIQNSPIEFPRPIMKDGTFNFSFSGLKTAVLVLTKKIVTAEKLNSAEEIDLETKQKIAAAFEEAVADVLSFKLGKAIEKYQSKTVVFAGGVSANLYLRDRLKVSVERLNPDIKFLTPTREMSGDNAAMIGLAAYYHIKRGDTSTWRDIQIDANLKLV